MNVWFPSLTETLFSFKHDYKIHFLTLQTEFLPPHLREPSFSCSFFPKELCISLCKLPHAKSTLSNPNMEANPQPESQSSFQAVSRKWGVKLPWLQCPPPTWTVIFCISVTFRKTAPPLCVTPWLPRRIRTNCVLHSSGLLLVLLLFCVVPSNYGYKVFHLHSPVPRHIRALTLLGHIKLQRYRKWSLFSFVEVGL